MSSALHIQATILPGHRIEIVSPELPEGGTVDVFVVLRGAVSPGGRRQVLQLPLEERRRLMTEQAEKLAGEYADSSERSDWQGGDIVES
jgi:hypothetical protein